MNVWLMAHTPNPEDICGAAASVCVGKRGPSASGLAHAIESGHGTVLEHASFTFEIEGLSRAALAQLTRHRIASFDVESQRYVAFNDVEPIIPDTIQHSAFKEKYLDMVNKAMDLYWEMVEGGIPREDARYITPQAIPTKLVVTMNARELRHFFSLRCCNRAQWEIRELADKILSICKSEAPALFANCGPGCVTGTCREARPCGHPRTGEELFE